MCSILDVSCHACDRFIHFCRLPRRDRDLFASWHRRLYVRRQALDFFFDVRYLCRCSARVLAQFSVHDGHLVMHRRHVFACTLSPARSGFFALRVGAIA